MKDFEKDISFYAARNERIEIKIARSLHSLRQNNLANLLIAYLTATIKRKYHMTSD